MTAPSTVAEADVESLDVPPPIKDFSEPYVPPEKPRERAVAPRVPTPLPAPVEPEAEEVAEAVSTALVEPSFDAEETIDERESFAADVEESAVAGVFTSPEASWSPPIEQVVTSAASEDAFPPLPRPGAPRRSRAPLVLAVLAIVAAVTFVMLRPRPSVESLAPAGQAATPPAATPVTAQAPAANAGSSEPVAATTAGATAATRAPAYVVELPDAPPPAPRPEPTDEELVPAAPSLGEVAPAVPVSGLAPRIEVDPSAEQRQRSLEATRRQIDQQLRR